MIKNLGVGNVSSFSAGGLVVFFDRVEWCTEVNGVADLMLRGMYICSILPSDKGGKSRIRELKKAGFLK